MEERGSTPFLWACLLALGLLLLLFVPSMCHADPCMWPWTELTLHWDAAANVDHYEVYSSREGLVATVPIASAKVLCPTAATTWSIQAISATGETQRGPESDPIQCLNMEPVKPWSIVQMRPALDAWMYGYPTCAPR